MRLKLAFVVLLTILGSITATAEEAPRPGKIAGYFTTDRWGQDILVTGTSVYFVATAPARTLSEYTDKPVVVDVAEWFQEMNPGAAMIRKVTSAKPAKPSPDLQITVMPAKKSVGPGEGVAVDITIANKSNSPQKWAVRQFYLCLATNKPVEPKGFRDPEGRAYWYHQEAMTRGRDTLTWAVRDERVPLDAKQVVAEGEKVTRVSAPGDDHAVVAIAPGGKFATRATIGKELPPGDYQVFAFISGSDGCPAMAARVNITVAADKPAGK